MTVLVLAAVIVFVVSALVPAKISPERYMSGNDAADWGKLTKDLGGGRRIRGFLEKYAPYLLDSCGTAPTAENILKLATSMDYSSDPGYYVMRYIFRARYSSYTTEDIEEYFGIRFTDYTRKVKKED